MTAPPQIELLGKPHAIILPSYAEREEIYVAWGQVQTGNPMRKYRALAAAIGLCTRLGRHAEADYVALGCEPLRYGGAVYGYLRDQGATREQVVTAGMTIIELVSDALFPREAEVAAELGKSEASAEPATASP